jgi:hypothetical protein
MTRPFGLGGHRNREKGEALTGYRSETIGPAESIDGRNMVSGRRMARLLYGMDRRRKSDIYSSRQ